jgi:WD40 repeat protein
MLRQGTLAVAGAEDGALLFFDLERDSRPCINKLLGHANSVIALGFSHDESLLASSDSKNQIIVWRKS